MTCQEKFFLQKMTFFRFCGKKVSSLVLVSYILLYLTAGGLHRSLESPSPLSPLCEGGDKRGVDSELTTHDSQLTTHNTDTCLICQWFKNPTTNVHTIAVNWQLLPVISGSFHCNNTLPNILHVNNFLTRAPPSFPS